MVGLIQNEWIKLFKRPGTYVMAAVLLLFITAFAAFTKYETSKQAHETNWKQEVQAETALYQKQLAESAGITKEKKEFIEGQIAVNECRLAENKPVDTAPNMWSFVESANDILQFAGLFIIVIAGGIVASEFSWGTVKLLLIRPISRSKVLLSKYATVVLFGLFLTMLAFLFSVVIGALLFGIEGESVHLAYNGGQIVEQNILFYLLKLYGLNMLDLLMMATMAFMISAVFRNSSLAIGISLFLLFTGPNVTYLLSMRYDWAKYLLFANTDLTQFQTGDAMVEGMTIGFSLTMLALYFAFFQLLAFGVFQKRDVAA
ncbi:ABC transporter permease [Domibacillus robiginosus]|uniref:ABC transporter permease n=1 Tax=Domibacillus robiginosus TaxID=1071054 RepID=UPI00067DEAEA|nr:ABC transporter permease [Domibacillus robiginosus]